MTPLWIIFILGLFVRKLKLFQSCIVVWIFSNPLLLSSRSPFMGVRSVSWSEGFLFLLLLLYTSCYIGFTCETKKNLTIIKMVRKTIQELCDRCQHYHKKGERLGLTLNTAKTAEYLKTMSRMRGISGWKITKRRTSRIGGCLLNWLNRILADSFQGNQISRLERISLNWLSRILTKTGLSRPKTMRPSTKECSEEPN